MASHMPELKSSYRVVVQRVGSVFLLIAYGSKSSLQPVTFSSFDELLVRLRGVVPDADLQLSKPADAMETRVIFSRNVEMGDAELQVLGLRPVR